MLLSCRSVFMASDSHVCCSKSYHVSVHFLRAKAATSCFQHVLAIAILSVRPSVCLSVTRVNQSKRCKLGSPNLHHQLPGRLVSETAKIFHKFEGVTLNEGTKWEGGSVLENDQSLTIFSCVNIHDFERPWPSKIRVFVDFCNLRLQPTLQEWIVTKWLKID